MDKKLEKMFAAYHYAGGYELFFKTGAFTEQLFDMFDGKIPESYTKADQVLKLIRRSTQAESDEYGAIVEELIKIRKEIEEEMRSVVELRDNLVVCDYVMKRLAEPEPTSSMDNDKEASAVLNLIFRNKDNAAVRDAVRTAVAVLPLRLAKTKFFDLVESALETQLGRNEKDIDDMVSNLEGYAGLKSSGNNAYDDKEASEVIDIIFSGDPGNNPKADIDELYRRTHEAAKRIGNRLDVLADIGLMINSLLLELTAAVHAGKEAGEVFANRDVTDYVVRLLDLFCAGDKKAFEEGLIYEGIDEEELVKLDELRGVLPGYEDRFISMAENESDEIYRDAKRCVTLISDSIFGSLEVNEDAGRTVDREMIMNRAKELKEKLVDAFGSGSKLLQRARMSGVLLRLPLFLNNSDEVREYVKNSLTSCRDEKEKAVAVREIKEYFAGTYEFRNEP
ncbi:MAG: hypothetical protein K6F93_08425 [Lachnospiraceae bacterium]|nr:hypothetical protein [Lachnospiraceae bacterium]